MDLDFKLNAQDNTDLQDTYTTRRVISPALEEMLYVPIKVLDHGFIRVIDYMGNDTSIVQAARVSYGAGTKQTSQDQNLISYLMRHAHTTPFEMCDIKLHIKLPIFVARQWIRHRTASVNEYSGRYSIMSDEYYIPSAAHLCPQSLNNKQGRAGQELSAEQQQHILNILKQDASQCYQHYIEMLNEDREGKIIDENTEGLTRELARMNLTMNYYTEWYWKINLHNLLHFLALRADHHAQYEIRVYAQIILGIVAEWVPMTHKAFTEYRTHGVKLSRTAAEVIKRRLRGEVVTYADSGMSKREWAELLEIFDIM